MLRYLIPLGIFLVLVAFSAVIPLMTVVNYSVQDTFGTYSTDLRGLAERVMGQLKAGREARIISMALQHLEQAMGLAAAGRPGVEKTLANFREEIERGMKLMGVRSVGELGRNHLRYR